MRDIEEIWMICNAYESGYGHGYDRRGLTNPYKGGTDQRKGWDYGFSEGEKKRMRHEENKRAKNMGVIG
jgi:hypothetical protein